MALWKDQLRDHPREYGENNLIGSSTALTPGSSPRIRGECPAPFDVDVAALDHPREYGENRRRGRWLIPLGGSSPRIRGEYQACQSFGATARIIPANTGRMLRVDPDNRTCCGSSPRIRGESGSGRYLHHTNRIIPANTGRIRSMRVSCTTVRDHPREYGENRSLPLRPNRQAGSSPRIRGESKLRCPVRCTGRIIPANTGRILVPRMIHAPVRDHPREYGENVCDGGASGFQAGSSPRIRGE